MATGELSGLVDSRYVGDNHEPKSGQNGLVTKREIESEGDPLEGEPSVGFLAPSVHVHIYVYVGVCCREKRKKKKRKKEKKRKRKGKRGKEKLGNWF